MWEQEEECLLKDNERLTSNNSSEDPFADIIKTPQAMKLRMDEVRERLIDSGIYDMTDEQIEMLLPDEEARIAMESMWRTSPSYRRGLIRDYRMKPNATWEDFEAEKQRRGESYRR